MKKGFTLADTTCTAHSHKIGKHAFTLAEVLITLGIIGVVAAITMPTLIQNHQKQTYVTGAKKAVSTISNMFKQIQADEEASSIANTNLITEGLCEPNWDWSSGVNKNGCEDMYGNHSVFRRIIPKYLNVVKTCEGNECDIAYKAWCHITNANKLDCSRYADTTLADSSSGGFSWGDTQAVSGFYTADGMIYYFVPSNNAIAIAVDINGAKGPNTNGRDLFYLAYCLNNGKILPTGANADDICIGRGSSRYTPLGHLMENGWKMDY